MRIKSSVLILVFLLLAVSVHASRIKDIAEIEGVRSNQLVGYGLVVGLNGTGDSSSTEFTQQSLVNMMEHLGMRLDRNSVKVDNVAAVMVTAKLPPFAKVGTTIDVLVSSMGDSSSLVGGTLIMTPLNGPDGQVYAVAQGPLAVGALAYGGKAAKVQKNHPTVGRIPGGALIEKEVAFKLPHTNELHYRLRQPDFTTVSRMATAVNNYFGKNLAHAVDSASLHIKIPDGYVDSRVKFIAQVEQIEVLADMAAKIIVNERTGTIVMGDNVRLSTVAVSHGNLNLVINESAAVSQPGPLGGKGKTVTVPNTSLTASEDKGNLVVLPMGVSIGDVARALNAIGATPRDLIAIFQAIKAAGALHAELVVL